ncbi:MAG: RT0821/Lpp0805 family surface protein [Pseudomonadota bacterium]
MLNKITRYFNILFIIFALLISSACTNGQGFNIKKENIGLITGAIGGAWAGSNVGGGKGRVAAIAAGTLLGAALGKSIGSSLDKADMAYYNQTSQQALETNETGQVSSWNNPDSGVSGTIKPVKTYREASTQRYCREYTQTITVNNQTETAYGTACRQPDGSWKITS